MLYIIRTEDSIRATYNDDEFTAATDAGHKVEFRMDWEDFATVEAIAAELTEASDNTYIGVDRGSHTFPRYDVVEIPKVGDKVSKGFNGDYYPDGEVARISASLKVITTTEGTRFYRKALTGSWVSGGTWSLVKGHISKLNPHF